MKSWFVTKEAKCCQCKGTGVMKHTDWRSNWYMWLFLAIMVVFLSLVLTADIWFMNAYGNETMREFITKICAWFD